MNVLPCRVFTIGRPIGSCRPGYRFTIRALPWPDSDSRSASVVSGVARSWRPVLCVKTIRVLRCDWTVAHHGQLYQIDQACPDDAGLAHREPSGWDDADYQQDWLLRYHAITSRPMKVTVSSPSIPAAVRKETEVDASLASPS